MFFDFLKFYWDFLGFSEVDFFTLLIFLPFRHYFAAPSMSDSHMTLGCVSWVKSEQRKQRENFQTHFSHDDAMMSTLDKEKNAGKERRIFLICCMLWERGLIFWRSDILSDSRVAVGQFFLDFFLYKNGLYNRKCYKTVKITILVVCSRNMASLKNSK